MDNPKPTYYIMYANTYVRMNASILLMHMHVSFIRVIHNFADNCF